MNTYKCTVRVASPLGHGQMVTWAYVNANNPNVARQMLLAQYGHGSVTGIPVLI
jgi:hypothetical protein